VQQDDDIPIIFAHPPDLGREHKGEAATSRNARMVLSTANARQHAAIVPHRAAPEVGRARSDLIQVTVP
jgi:hypothetical protein